MCLFGWGMGQFTPQTTTLFFCIDCHCILLYKKQAWVWLTHYTRQESLNLKTSNMPKDPWFWRANLPFSNKRFGTIFLPIKISHNYSKFQICKCNLIMVLVLHFFVLVYACLWTMGMVMSCLWKYYLTLYKSYIPCWWRYLESPNIPCS